MGKRRTQTFLQRQHTDGQKAHEKMLNTASYQRNASQNYNEVSPHNSQNSHHQIINAKEGMEEKEPSYNVGGNVSWYSHYGKHYGGSLKKKSTYL